jgi:hypothetical protein
LNQNFVKTIQTQKNYTKFIIHIIIFSRIAITLSIISFFTPNSIKSCNELGAYFAAINKGFCPFFEMKNCYWRFWRKEKNEFFCESKYLIIPYQLYSGSPLSLIILWPIEFCFSLKPKWGVWLWHPIYSKLGSIQDEKRKKNICHHVHLCSSIE